MENINRTHVDNTATLSGVEKGYDILSSTKFIVTYLTEFEDL